MGFGDVVCCAPDFGGGGVLGGRVSFRGGGDGRWVEGLAWSVRVSQWDLEMRVTTRPGASGVPR